MRYALTRAWWTTFLGFLLHSAVWRKTKQTKNACTLDLLHGKSCKFHRVCVVIFLPLRFNLVMWYELNKKLRNILLLFPIPSHAHGKPTWWSRVWWLAKFVWYDITWKTPIHLQCTFLDSTDFGKRGTELLLQNVQTVLYKIVISTWKWFDLCHWNVTIKASGDCIP